MSFHPPCSVVPDGIPEQLTDGRMSHPYRGTDGNRYAYLAADDAKGEWIEVEVKEPEVQSSHG